MKLNKKSERTLNFNQPFPASPLCTVPSQNFLFQFPSWRILDQYSRKKHQRIAQCLVLGLGCFLLVVFWVISVLKESICGTGIKLSGNWRHIGLKKALKVLMFGSSVHNFWHSIAASVHIQASSCFFIATVFFSASSLLLCGWKLMLPKTFEESA